VLKLKPKRKKCNICGKMYTQTDPSVNDYNCPNCSSVYIKTMVYTIIGFVSIFTFFNVMLSPSSFVLGPMNYLILKIIAIILVLIVAEYLFFKSDYKINSFSDTVCSKIICLVKSFSIVTLPFFIISWLFIDLIKNIDGVINWWVGAWYAWLFIIPWLLLIVAYFGINHIIKKRLNKNEKGTKK
jgi:hypothetical protein